jgi:hypothetical protein
VIEEEDERQRGGKKRGREDIEGLGKKAEERKHEGRMEWWDDCRDCTASSNC